MLATSPPTSGSEPRASVFAVARRESPRSPTRGSRRSGQVSHRRSARAPERTARALPKRFDSSAPTGRLGRTLPRPSGVLSRVAAFRGAGQSPDGMQVSTFQRRRKRRQAAPLGRYGGSVTPPSPP